MKAAINWALNDEFWRSNILSMSKLREQYDKLRLRAAAEKSKPEPGGTSLWDEVQSGN